MNEDPLIVYVAGRYRWHEPDGSLNRARMMLEMADEGRWARLVLDCGGCPISPIHNTVHLEGTVPHERFIELDLSIVRTLRPGQHLILMRPCYGELHENDPRPEWYPPGVYVPPSAGATKELEAATEHGLGVALGEQGEELVREYLLSEMG